MNTRIIHSGAGADGGESARMMLIYTVNQVSEVIFMVIRSGTADAPPSSKRWSFNERSKLLGYSRDAHLKIPHDFRATYFKGFPEVEIQERRTSVLRNVRRAPPAPAPGDAGRLRDLRLGPGVSLRSRVGVSRRKLEF
ncbi:hypothetical protein EVAR_40933_1 [Eumeta japonica]|uniref:Uncharacterized protein n=1 Tax=Eumeta variegata TaxID=151549 RepID=A0A4C1X7P6_EUMVA|nr:hypothetical protein EVAR_40933_1 [Eumeta japonica]